MERKSSRVSKDVKTQNKAKMPQKKPWAQYHGVKAVFSEGCFIRRPACQSRWVEPSSPCRGNPASVSAQVGPAQSAGLKWASQNGKIWHSPPSAAAQRHPRKSSWRSEQRRSHHLCFLLSGKMKKLCSPAGWSLAGIQGASFSCGHL